MRSEEFKEYEEYKEFEEAERRRRSNTPLPTRFHFPPGSRGVVARVGRSQPHPQLTHPKT